MINSRRTALAALPALGLFFGASRAHAKDDEGKIAFHISNSVGQATATLRSIRNLLDTAPNNKVVVVAHADGLDFLREDAKDPSDPNVQYPALINALASRGVRFEICEITMKRLGLTKDDFVMDANFTLSGVVRLGELQNKEGYAYLRI